MDLRQAFCPNLDCPARGKEARPALVFLTHETALSVPACGKTFATTTGTMWYRLRTAAEEVRIVITLLAHGCPQHAIVATYGVDERLVANGLVRTGEQSQAVHAHSNHLLFPYVHRKVALQL